MHMAESSSRHCQVLGGIEMKFKMNCGDTYVRSLSLSKALRKVEAEQVFAMFGGGEVRQT